MARVTDISETSTMVKSIEFAKNGNSRRPKIYLKVDGTSVDLTYKKIGTHRLVELMLEFANRKNSDTIEISQPI
ncbi:MAG: hypothetical protein WBB29_06380 [Geitlerinemataceae cyanobacterium]